MRIQFLIFLLLITLSATGQKIIGFIKSASNKEQIPYANILIVGKQAGAYSNEEGRFEISASFNDSLSISSIGYKRLTIMVKNIIENNSVILLQPEMIQLQAVTVLAKKSKVKFERHSFGYLKTKRRSLISSGVPGIQFVTFIKNNLGKQGIIESLLLGISCDHKSRIRIRLYMPTLSKGVGTEITRQNLLFDVAGNHRPYKIDLTKYQITFSKDGIVVGIEFLGEIDNNNNIKKGTTSHARLYLTDGLDSERNTWQNYRDNTFVRESFSINQHNTSNALIGLSAVFDKD